MFEYGLQKSTERKGEVDMFNECVEEAKRDNKEQGSTKINDFMEYKRKVELFWTLEYIICTFIHEMILYNGQHVYILE